MRNRTPYPSYKTSGIDWLGDIPSHWTVGALGSGLVSIVTGGTPESGSSEYWSLDDSGIPFVTIGDMSNTDIVSGTTRRITDRGAQAKGLKPMPVGTVLYSMYASVGKASILEIEAVANQAILGLTGKPTMICQKYLWRWLTVWEPFIETLTNSSTQSNINMRIVRKLATIFPPLDEQRAIADYLDRKDAEITRFIDSRRRMIALLEEKKQAIINQAVTRGLDPSVPMKDSGVEWLGEIPAHWEVRRLSSFWRVQGGFAFQSSSFTHVGIPVVRMSNLKRGHLDLSHAMRIPEEAVLPAFALSEQDILIGMSGSLGDSGSVGSVGVVQSEHIPAQLNQRVGRYKFNAPGYTQSLLLEFIQTTIYRELIEAKASGSAQFNISPAEFTSMYVPVPPNNEQIEICEKIHGIQCTHSKQITRYEREIELIGEYRTRLISDVVTGKVKVD